MLASRKLVKFVVYRSASAGLHSLSRVSNHAGKHLLTCVHFSQVRWKKNPSFNSIFQSGSSKDSQERNKTINKTKKLTPREISVILTEFIRKPEVRNLATDRGLNGKYTINLSLTQLDLVLVHYICGGNWDILK